MSKLSIHPTQRIKLIYPNLKEFSRLLETEAGRVSNFFVVFDECTGGQQSGVDILLESQNIRLMITGRPYVEDAVLSKCKDSTKLMIRASDCDIRKTIESYIDQSVYLSKVTETNPSLRETIMDSLVTKSKGMYSTVLWILFADGRYLQASLHLAFLEEQKNEHHRLLSALNQLPKGLEETYDAAVSRINNRPIANDVKVAIKTLKWLTFVKENIQARALQYAIAVRDDSTDIQEADLESIQTVCLVPLPGTGRHGSRRRHDTSCSRNHKNIFGHILEGNFEIASVCLDLRYFSFSCFSRGFEWGNDVCSTTRLAGVGHSHRVYLR
jgi:hypothetical protein